MDYSFSVYDAETVSPRPVRASGIDQEAVHRIRQQGRIARAKILRRCFVALSRAATAARFGAGVS